MGGGATDAVGDSPDGGGSPWLARPALDFVALALATLAAAGALPGWPRWLLLWPAAAWGALAWAFHANRPELLGKRPDGSRLPIAALFWLPYLFFPRLVRLYKRLVGMDPVPWHEVAPGLWLGRRPTRGERPPAVDVAVDLAAEVANSAARIAPARYVGLPALNKLAPPAAEVVRLVNELAPSAERIFVFCSAGKGRSATVVAALLVARGHCASAADAERHLARVRPGVRLHRGQRRLVERFRPLERSETSDPRPALRPRAAAGS